MINLEKFLNNGGKRYRVASKHDIQLALGDTAVISPASDEFVVYFSEDNIPVDITTPRTVISEVGFNQVGAPISFGLGESTTFSYSGATSNGFAKGTAFIYEEDV